MGYGGAIFQTLSELRRNGTLAGVRNVIDLGAQESFLDHSQVVYVAEFLEAFGVQADPEEVKALVEKRFVKYIWERAGIAYTSTDYDAQFETVFIDLNYDDVPQSHRNAYDLVTNCGTTEHVVNQMNSFRVVHDLTRPGGYMLHDLPWSGHFNHGLYNYKPHLFWRLCQSNGYAWVGMRLRAQVNDPVPLPDNILSYCSDRDREIYQRYFSHDGNISVVLRKTHDMPFVCPLDMEATMILPDGVARKRYWTLADADAFSKVEAHRQTGFPNAEETATELRERCRQLEGRIRWMEGSRFWRLRNALRRLRPGRAKAG